MANFMRQSAPNSGVLYSGHCGFSGPQHVVHVLAVAVSAMAPGVTDPKQLGLRCVEAGRARLADTGCMIVSTNVASPLAAGSSNFHSPSAEQCMGKVPWSLSFRSFQPGACLGGSGARHHCPACDIYLLLNSIRRLIISIWTDDAGWLVNDGGSWIDDFLLFLRSIYGWIFQDAVACSVIYFTRYRQIGPFDTIFLTIAPPKKHSFDASGFKLSSKCIQHFALFNGSCSNAVNWITYFPNA